MNRWLKELMRVGVLLVLAGLALYFMDDANIVVVQAMLVGIFLVGGSHVTRRILFPNLDLQLMATRAAETPTGAAVVFAAVLGFLVAVIFASMSVLK